MVKAMPMITCNILNWAIEQQPSFLRVVFEINFSKNLSGIHRIIGLSNSLVTDQIQTFVRPDLGQNYLLSMLSTDNMNHNLWGKS